MNYEKDLKIDESALDVEWINQPTLAFKYGKYYAELCFELEIAEESLQVLKAELTDTINQNPDEFLGAGVKTTVANVESAIIQDKDYKKLKAQIFQLRKEVQIAKIAYTEISVARKSALQNLVDLCNHQYFASPAMPRNLSTEVQKMEHQKNLNTKIKINRNK